MKFKNNLLIIFLLFTNNAFAFTFKNNSTVDYDSFTLHKKNGNYYLLLNQNEAAKKYNIPKEWFKTKKILHEKLESYISLNKFMSRVITFSINQNVGLYGLHLSSYDIHDFGGKRTPGAAGGRDIFLIFDKVEEKFYMGMDDLGITKMRLKYGRCFSGKFTTFIIQKLPLNSGVGIGVTTEEISCTEYTREGKIIISPPRYFKISPRKWYLFKGKEIGWEYASKIGNMSLDGYLNVTDAIKLPNICFQQTTTDFLHSFTNESRISVKPIKGCTKIE